MMEVVALTVAEFCQRANIGKTLFYAEVAAGNIRIIKRGKKTEAFPAGRKTLVPASELVRYAGLQEAA